MVLTSSGLREKSAIILLGILPLLFSYLARPYAIGIAISVALLLLAVFTLFYFPYLPNAFDFLCQALFGTIYIGFCASHLVLLRALPDGVFWLLFLSALTVASDSGAYYIGKLLGRRKLCPKVSPGKTVEGFAGGLVAGTLAATVVAFFFLPGQSAAKIILLAVFLICLGVLGDLTESIIKRSTGVKDSGTIMPGHGGILDRADSILLTAPVLYYFVYFGFLVCS